MCLCENDRWFAIFFFQFGLWNLSLKIYVYTYSYFRAKNLLFRIYFSSGASIVQDMARGAHYNS